MGIILSSIMKRYMDLIGQILRHVEREHNGQSLEIRKLDGFTCRQIQYHVELCVEAGYLQGQPLNRDKCQDEHGLYVIWQIHRLTWAGHEFLDPTS